MGELAGLQYVDLGGNLFAARNDGLTGLADFNSMQAF